MQEINEGYKNLANAIILQACKDYKSIEDKKYKNSNAKKSTQHEKYNAQPKEITKFFNSGWFSTLCGDAIDGKTILKQLETNYLKYGNTLINLSNDENSN